jgi:hypothetical protein
MKTILLSLLEQIQIPGGNHSQDDSHGTIFSAHQEFLHIELLDGRCRAI